MSKIENLVHAPRHLKFDLYGNSSETLLVVSTLDML